MGLSVGVGAGPVRYSKSIRLGGGTGLTGAFVAMFKLGFLMVWWMAVAMWWLFAVLPYRAVQATVRAVQKSRKTTTIQQGPRR